MTQEFGFGGREGALVAHRYHLVGVAVLLLISTGEAHAAIVCKNPGGEVYNKSPTVFAPEAQRTVGVLIEAETGGRAVPDTRAECLPIALRYNNIGSIQTPKGGWPNQIGKDKRNTAVFPSVKDGLRVMMIWLQRRDAEKINTAFKIMSRYAPPDDCVGSLDKLPNGTCPKGFNDTAGYAKKISGAVGLGINDKLDLNGGSCSGRKTIRSVARTIMTYEIGAKLCHKTCDVEEGLFNSVADEVWAPVTPGCS